MSTGGGVDRSYDPDRNSRRGISMTVHDICEAYIREKDRIVVDIRRIESSLGNVCRFLGSVEMRQLKPSHITAYQEKRLTQGASPGTVWQETGKIRTAINWAWKSGLIQQIPCHIPMPEPGAVRKNFLNPDEVGRLLKAATDAPLWFEAAVLLLFYTGQRINAVLTLQWNQIDEKGGIIDFNAGITKASRRKKRAVLPITESIAEVLKCGNRYSSYVLTRGVGGDLGDRSAIPYRAFVTQWRKALDRAGLPYVCPHTARHSVATNLVRSGIPIEQVSKMLGHASMVTTEKVYAKYSPEFARGAMERAATVGIGRG